jgi:putative copper resistance protein D
MDALLIVARTLHFAATAALEGTFVFWCFIARPAFRQVQAARALEARLDRRLLALSWTSLLIALASGVVWLFVVASQMSGVPLGTILPQGVVGIVLTSTQFGEDWRLRAALVIVIAACLAVQGRIWKQAWCWIGLVSSAALVASLAWAGHGAAAEDVPWDALHLPADILHLLATGAWLGALFPLALLLAAARRDGGPEGVAVARGATLRFSTLGIASVATLLATGLVNTWFLSGTIPALVGTLYGQLLLVKVLLFTFMVAIAGVNRRRLTPYLERVAGEASIRLRAVGQLGRNALIEASLGVIVLAVVGIIGILPPGLHTEPGWPFPFRLDLNEIVAGAQTVLVVAALLFVLCLAACAITAEKKNYRGMAASIAGLVLFGIIGWMALRPGIVDAYPTSFYAPTQPYAAPSIARGAPLYAANCAACHGVDGRGDGVLATRLPIRPADLTETHIFAHSVGDIFWWVSNGRANGVMPGFADKLTPDQRWDLINFVLARAAGAVARATGSRVTTAAAPPLPDFAFEQLGAQNTLSQTLKTGPVLLILFAPPAPRARFEQLATLTPRLGAVGLRIIAVDLAQPTEKAAAGAASAAPFVVNVSDDVRASLALFRSATDGDETELMLDRGASVRARRTTNGAGGLADAATLLSDAVRVASIPVAAANHAGHAH